MPERSITYLPVDDVPAADRNAKTHQRDLIAESITTFGFTAPVVLDERTERLVAGHGRLEALRQLREKDHRIPDGVTASEDGRWLVPVVRGWASEDDAHAQAVVIADNRATEAGGWDNHMLAELLDEVADYSPDLLGATGFSQDDLDQLIADLDKQRDNTGGGEGEDDTPEPPAEPHTRLGDLWLLEGRTQHRLVCGDARDPDTYTRLLGGSHADLMWTDPPYGVDYVGKTDDALTLSGDDPDSVAELLSQAFAAAGGALKPGAPVYVAHPAGPLHLVFGKAFVDAGWRLHQTLVWVKDRMVLGHADHHYRHEPLLFGYTPAKGRRGRGGHGWFGGNDRTSVFEVARPSASREHPTQKPVALVAANVANSSRSGHLLLDPFAGSGTTIVAGEQLGRRGHAIELDPAYCDVICRRFFDRTGRVPRHADTGAPFPVDSVAASEPGPDDSGGLGEV